MNHLTEDERKVIELASVGFVDKELARELRRSEDAIGRIWRRVFYKLDARSRAMATAIYWRGKAAETCGRNDLQHASTREKAES